MLNTDGGRGGSTGEGFCGCKETAALIRVPPRHLKYDSGASPLGVVSLSREQSSNMVMNLGSGIAMLGYNALSCSNSIFERALCARLCLC